MSLYLIKLPTPSDTQYTEQLTSGCCDLLYSSGTQVLPVYFVIAPSVCVPLSISPIPPLPPHPWLFFFSPNSLPPHFVPHIPHSFAPVPVFWYDMFCLPGIGGGLSPQVSSASQSRALASKETSQGKVSSLSIPPHIITSSLFLHAFTIIPLIVFHDSDRFLSAKSTCRALHTSQYSL